MQNDKVKLKICLLILCALAVAGCQSPFVPQRLELQSEPVVVPMRLEKNVPLVEVFINEQGPYTFLLDTGAGAVHISAQLADELNLPDIWWMKYTAVTGSGKEVKCDLVHIEKLQIGSAEFGEFKASIMDLAKVSHAIGAELDGIVGFSLFADCLLTMDFPKSEIIIEKGKLPKANGLDLLPMDVRDDTPVIPVFVCAKLRRFLVDTGCNGGFDLSDRLVGKTVPIKEKLEGQSESWTFAGPEQNWFARLDGDIRVGSCVSADPVVAVSSMKDNDGHLGTLWLSRFAVTFDQQHKVVRLRFGIRLPELRGATMRTGSEGWLVTKIKEGSSAEHVGLKVGDMILQLNDQPVGLLRPESVRQLAKITQLRKLVVTRDGERMEIEVAEKESSASEAAPAASP